MNKKSLITWGLAIALGVGFSLVKTLTESDADKAKRAEAIDSTFNKFMISVDKTGELAQGLAQADALGKFFTFCKANLVPNDSGAPFSDDEKKSYCGCATLGMQKLYYARLSPDELIDISKRPSAPDLGPEDTQRQVFAACGASRDAYSK